MRLFLLLAAIIGSYLFLNPPLTVIAELPPFPAAVEITVKPGVSNYEEQAVRRAVSLTARMLQSEAGLALTHPVRILLVPDSASYYWALSTEEGMDRDSALFQASTSSGSTNEMHVIINCGAVPQYNDLVFITAHEMTHQFQFAGKGEWSRNNWLLEGMAEVVGATVVGINQDKNNVVNDYRQQWQQQLDRAQLNSPGLKELDERLSWGAAFRQYKAIAYRRSALAVFQLADEYGFRGLGSYINLRNAGLGAEDAFAEAFHQSLADYYVEQDSLVKGKNGR